MILSIIIPYYNVKQYTDELLDILAPQIMEGVEVILVDDGSRIPYKTHYEWCKIYRQENKGVSAARNKGIELSTGEYIAFIDADDLVTIDYISQIMAKMPFDYLDMSWKSLPGGDQFESKLNTENDRLRNPSAVTRAFSRVIIGNIRFNEQKQAAEDAEFIMAVCREGLKVAVVTDYLYFYRTYTPNSLTKRFMSGETATKRIIYHYRRITADMTDLLEEIKRENEHHEVYVLTERNEISEISRYAKVMEPCKVRGSELRGEPTPYFSQILPAPEFDIIIYTSQNAINGIYTWIYSFCHQMADKYSIAVLHTALNGKMIEKLQDVAYVKCVGDPVKCHTLIMMRIRDNIPLCVYYKQSVQILHSTRINPEWKLPEDRDYIIPVSDVVRQSWDIPHETVHNMTYPDIRDTVIKLISATRLNTQEKGLERMRQLVNMMNAAKIPFIWECYSDSDPEIKGITHHSMQTNIRQQIRDADYLVQLSDEEGFCYSIVEALEEGTAVITTPIKVLDELGFVDCKHGYVFGFDMSGNIKRLLNVPTFTYSYDNDPIKKQWLSILGKGKGEAAVRIRCVKRFRDMTLDKYMEVDEECVVNARRAEEIISSGYAVRCE